MSKELKPGEILKELREKRGLNSTQLSELSNLSRPYLSQIESGKRKPSFETLNRLAEPLGLSSGEILSKFGVIQDGATADVLLENAQLKAENEKLKQQLKTIKQLLEEF